MLGERLIAPGGSDTFTVRRAISQTGTFSGAVSFATNDAGNNPAAFNVTGPVVEFLSADPGWLDPSLQAVDLAKRFTGGH